MINKFGVTGLVLSIIGLIILPLAPVFGFIGLILCVIGVMRVSKDPTLGGKASSIIGIIISSISFVLWLMVIPLFISSLMSGVPNVGNTLQFDDSTVYWQTASIGVDSFVASKVEPDNVVFKNNMPTDIIIKTVVIGDSVIYTQTSEEFIILMGQTKKLSELTPGVSSDMFYCARSGDLFSEAVSIGYEDKKTGEVNTFVSSVNLEGECSA